MAPIVGLRTVTSQSSRSWGRKYSLGCNCFLCTGG